MSTTARSEPTPMPRSTIDRLNESDEGIHSICDFAIIELSERGGSILLSSQSLTDFVIATIMLGISECLAKESEMEIPFHLQQPPASILV